MANRNTLHKNKLEAFKKYLDNKGIAYRPGKGDYQALQILTPQHGWKCIYTKNNMPEHFSIDRKLLYIVMDFIKPKNTERKHNYRDCEASGHFDGANYCYKCGGRL